MKKNKNDTEYVDFDQSSSSINLDTDLMFSDYLTNTTIAETAENEKNITMSASTLVKKNVMTTNMQRQMLINIMRTCNLDVPAACKEAEIGYETGRKIARQYEKTGQTDLKNKPGRVRTKNVEGVRDQVEAYVSTDPQITLKEMQKKLFEYYGEGFTISISTINRCLKELAITLKQAHNELAIVNHPDKIAARKQYSLWYGDMLVQDDLTIVFIDESSFNLHFKKHKARSKKGTRANILVLTIRGKSVSLIGAISKSGWCYHELITKTTVKGDVFFEFLKNLCARLKNVKKLKNVFLY